jgi:hypothetical protein
MNTLRSCLGTLGRIIVLPLGILLGAGLGTLIGALVFLTTSGGTQPAAVTAFGAGIGLVAVLLLRPWRRAWPMVGILLLGVLLVVVSALAATQLSRFAGSSAVAGAATALIFAAIIVGNRAPHWIARSSMALAITLAGGWLAATFAGWGVVFGGALAGGVWALADPKGIAEFIANQVSERSI